MHADAVCDHSRMYPTRYRALLAFLLLLAAYHVAFGQFFPNKNGTLGHDYSIALPGLLAGYYWFRANGPWDVPWFTPAFCGGQPFFADPQVGYYSALQLLTLGADPLTSSYLTTLLFAALGYWGCYLLLRRAFAVNQHPAVLGAAIFMFNGFFAHRALVGHLGYHGFMLIPWLAYVLVAPSQGKSHSWLGNAAAGCLAGLIVAYWVQSGLGTLLVPSGLAVVLILLVHALWADRPHRGRVVFRSVVGGLTAGAVSAAKLVAAFSFISNFPRTDYLLPGYRSVADAIDIAFVSLFFSPTDIEERSNAVLENVQWAIGRHELEYGVTVVPLLILLAGIALGVWSVFGRRTRIRLGPSRVILIVLIGLIVLLPLALNTYSPEWNRMLKQTPLLKSASTFVRWFCVYIPILALSSALILQRFPARIQIPAAVVGFGFVVVLNLIQDRTAYGQESYGPGTISSAYLVAEAATVPPPIRDIGVHVASDGRVIVPINRNDPITQGISQLYCYNPVFGYRLENFPFGDLHPGPVRELRDGRFNIKNPACYVYPKENDCSPGDHFREAQREEMEKFVSYRPFAFNVSIAQKAANALTAFGIAASVLVVLAAGTYWLVSLISGARRSPAGAGPI